MVFSERQWAGRSQDRVIPTTSFSNPREVNSSVWLGTMETIRRRTATEMEDYFDLTRATLGYLLLTAGDENVSDPLILNETDYDRFDFTLYGSDLATSKGTSTRHLYY